MMGGHGPVEGGVRGANVQVAQVSQPDLGVTNVMHGIPSRKTCQTIYRWFFG